MACCFFALPAVIMGDACVLAGVEVPAVEGNVVLTGMDSASVIDTIVDMKALSDAQVDHGCDGCVRAELGGVGVGVLGACVCVCGRGWYFIK